jgi:hypothetical protein
MYLFTSSGEGGGEDIYSVVSLKCLLPHLHLRTETDTVSETCSLEYQTMEKVQKPSNSMSTDECLKQ